MKKIDKALHEAVLNTRLEEIKIALEKGADVNSKDEWDNLPLYILRAHAKYSETMDDCFKLLLKHGAKTYE